MGYSSPKKQLELKEFLSQPAAPGKYRSKWTRTGATPPKSPAPEKPVSDLAAKPKK